jgi:hypothetical protein
MKWRILKPVHTLTSIMNPVAYQTQMVWTIHPVRCHLCHLGIAPVWTLRDLPSACDPCAHSKCSPAQSIPGNHSHNHTRWVCKPNSKGQLSKEQVNEGTKLLHHDDVWRHPLCGLVVRVSEFSEKQWVWNGVHSASWVQLRSYLKEILLAPVLKNPRIRLWGSIVLAT